MEQEFFEKEATACTGMLYAEMDSIYENTPWASLYDGQWRCRYLMQMPGFQEWPESVGLTVKTGDLLRVKLPKTK